MDLPNPYSDMDGCQINVVTRINPRVTLGNYPKKHIGNLLMGYSVDSTASLCNNGVNSGLLWPFEE
jgi:hypothetical protein